MTRIEWTEETWNPIRGCRRVSAGCAQCYAEKMAARFSGPRRPYEGLTSGGKWTGRARFVPEMLDRPLRWRKPRRVFVNSMSDLFHKDVTDEQIAAVFGVMAACPQHTFQVLTKRPERMVEWFRERSAFAVRHCLGEALGRVSARRGSHPGDERIKALWDANVWPLPNVWLGVSCENQAAANERIPLLLQTPAEVRWVSCEPLLGPIDLSVCSRVQVDRGRLEYWPWLPCWIQLRGMAAESPTIDWVVIGSESGPGARPMDLDWVRSIRDQCVSAGVPLFFKQRLDERGRKVSMPELDGRVWNQCPEVAS